MAELESCPFCGGKSVLVPLSMCSGYVACIGVCKMKTAKFWDDPMTEPEKERIKWHEIATAAWNRRAEDGK